MVIVACILGAMALLASACSAGSTSSGAAATTIVDEGTPTAGGTLRVGLTADVDGYDAVRNRWDPMGNLVGSTLYDTLMKFDEHRQIQPNLAESVTSDPSGMVWTIKLRSGVKFHDGTSLDGDAVKLNIDKRKADTLAGAALDAVREVVVVDPLTVEVRMHTPWFGYDATLAAQGGYMVAPSTINDPDGGSHPIGTGPFKFVSWVPGNAVKVVRNPDYWQQGKPYLDGIEFKIVPDQTALLAAVRTGAVDLAMTDDAQSVKALRDDKSLRSVEDDQSETVYVQLQEAAPPFQDRHARAALAYATNQQSLIDTLGAGIPTAATGPYSAKSRWYVSDSRYPAFDLTKAKDEVDQYRQATGQAKLSFTLRVPGGGAFKQVAEALQAQWAQAGIDTKVQVDDQAAFLADTFFGKFQAGMFRNFGYVNPDSNYLFWSSTTAKGIGQGSINFTQTKVPAIDQGLDGARQTNDDTKRKELYDQVQQALNTEQPYVWLYHVVWALGARPNVGGMGLPQQLGFGRTDSKPWWPEIWLRS